MKKLIYIFFIILTCINADDINISSVMKSEISQIDCFKENNLEACHDIADIYEMTARSSMAKSIFAYYDLCKKGDLDSCYDGMIVLNEFSGFHYNAKESIKDGLTKICQKNHKPSCDRVNNKISDNKLLTKNKKGEEYRESAKSSFNMSYEIYNIGCERDDKYSCLSMASLIKKGIGDSNKKRAFEIYEKECKENENSYPCVLMAVGYMDGDIVEKDTKKAEVMLKNLCEKGKDSACIYLAKLQNNDKDKKFYLEKSCKLNPKSGCHELGEYYYKKKDYKKVLDLLEKKCIEIGAKNANACYYSAKSLENIDKEKNKEKIRLYYQKSCRFGSAEACMEEEKYGN